MILDRLLGRPRALATKIPGRSIMSETPSLLYTGRQSAAGVNVSEEDALSLSAVFAGVSLLSSIIGSLPLSVYRKSGARREVEAGAHEHRILHTEYNPDMTASIGRRTSEFHRLLWGNEYGEIQRRGDRISAESIWPIEPWRVRADRDSQGVFYVVDGTRIVPARNMIHIPLISMNGVAGRSFVDYALSSLGVGIATQDFSARFFANGARPGGMLVHAGNPAEEKRREFQKNWTEFHGGSENANRTGVLWGGWDFKDVGGAMELDKAQLLETKRFSTEEVARWLNIPPHLLRDLSRATFSNIEHQGIDFVIYSLMPPLVNKEQEYDRKLLNPPDLYCKHNVAALLRGDSAARSQFYNQMFQMGAISQNEIRELEDMNPIDGGDVHYIPANMQSIEKANAPPVIEPKQPTPQPTPAEPPQEKPPAPQPNLQPIFADVFSRLGKKLANESRRAAKKPEQFMDWLDEFFPKFEATLSQALAPIDDESANQIAAEYCAAGRETLLDIAGAAKPQELFGLVDLKMNETHPTEWAAKALEKITCRSST